MPATPAWPPRSLPRLFVQAALSPGAMFTLDGPQAHYLVRVMRLGEGDEVALFDGTNGEWIARIAAAGKRRVDLIVEQRIAAQERVPDVTLAFAPIKKSRLDFLVEKAVELGVRRLQPVITSRCVVRDIKHDRMQAHIVEAAEQCGRTALASIGEPQKLTDWLTDRVPDPLYFADEQGGAPAIPSFTPPPATLLVGPEGGFTDEERAAIRAAPGARAISLGPRILRAETAGLAALAAYMASAGDWQG